MDQIPEPHLAEPLPQPSQEKQKPLCGLLEVGLIAFFFVAVLNVLVVAAVGFARHTTAWHNASLDSLLKLAWFSVPIQIAAYFATVAFMVMIVRLKNQGPFLPAIGWHAPKLSRLGAAVAMGIALAFFSMIAGALLEPWTPKSLPILEYLRDASSAYLLVFFGVLVAPLGEELFFRGLLYPALHRWVGVVPGILLTSAGFAALHGEQLAHAWAPLLIIFVVGMALTVAREKTGSVAVCVIIHMTYNFAIFAQLFLATQGFRHMERASLDSLRAALILW